MSGEPDLKTGLAIVDLLRRLAEAEAAHAADRALLRRALEALKPFAELPSRVVLHGFTSEGLYWIEAPMKDCGHAQALLSSLEAKRAMEEQG